MRFLNSKQTAEKRIIPECIVYGKFPPIFMILQVYFGQILLLDVLNGCTFLRYSGHKKGKKRREKCPENCFILDFLLFGQGCQENFRNNTNFCP